MLSNGNLKEHQQKIWENAKNFNSFLIIVLSEQNKEFAFFVPHRFEQNEWEKTGKQFAFYWINDG